MAPVITRLTVFDRLKGADFLLISNMRKLINLALLSNNLSLFSP